MNNLEISEIYTNIIEQIKKVVIGQEDIIELIVVAMISEGHILLEGVPGTAKTLLTQLFAKCTNQQFGRIQFTPDLMPGDILGTNLFNFQSNEFILNRGPIFTEILLADEINRTPPKTQAALLQAMNERFVTIDGKDYPISEHFLVIATQNPIEQQGTYPLPEAQLDRFLFKLNVEYPSTEEEEKIVKLHGAESGIPNLESLKIAPVLEHHTLMEIKSMRKAVEVSDEIVRYIVALVRETRQHHSLQYGASTRAATMIASAARSRAIIKNRNYVIPDDIKYLLKPTLCHRVMLSANAEIDGQRVDSVIEEILDQVEAPR